jgi:hypothetical protein
MFVLCLNQLDGDGVLALEQIKNIFSQAWRAVLKTAINHEVSLG